MTNSHEDGTLDFSQANCKGMPVHWWFPSDRPWKEQRQCAQMAIDICRDCPMRMECLDYSLVWEPVGIWGGFTEQQRATIRERRNITCRRQTAGIRKAKEDFLV